MVNSCHYRTDKRKTATHQDYSKVKTMPPGYLSLKAREAKNFENVTKPKFQDTSEQIAKRKVKLKLSCNQAKTCPENKNERELRSIYKALSQVTRRLEKLLEEIGAERSRVSVCPKVTIENIQYCLVLPEQSQF